MTTPSKPSPGPWQLVVWNVGCDPGLEQRIFIDATGAPVLFGMGPDSTDSEKANATLIAKAPELLAMLRELEWSDTGERGFSDSDKPDTRCPVCSAYGYDGHTPDCRLDALLRELP